MGLAYVADQGVGAGDERAAADSEQEEQKHDAAKAARARQGKQSDGDEGEAENKADFFALDIEQRADGDRGKHEAQGVRRGDGAGLAGREMEALGEFGKDRAQHGGDHSVDENGEDGGEDQHARSSIKFLVREIDPASLLMAGEYGVENDELAESVGELRVVGSFGGGGDRSAVD